VLQVVWGAVCVVGGVITKIETQKIALVWDVCPVSFFVKIHTINAMKCCMDSECCYVGLKEMNLRNIHSQFGVQSVSDPLDHHFFTVAHSK